MVDRCVTCHAPLGTQTQEVLPLKDAPPKLCPVCDRQRLAKHYVRLLPDEDDKALWQQFLAKGEQ
jgi:hypothetical protein